MEIPDISRYEVRKGELDQTCPDLDLLKAIEIHNRIVELPDKIRDYFLFLGEEYIISKGNENTLNWDD